MAVVTEEKPALLVWWEQWRQQVAAFVAQLGWLPQAAAGPEQPSLSLSASEQMLGEWCTLQRQRQTGRVQPPLTPEEQAALEVIPGWCSTGTSGPRCQGVGRQMRPGWTGCSRWRPLWSGTAACRGLVAAACEQPSSAGKQCGWAHLKQWQQHYGRAVHSCC